nr:MAG TPA: hypothetical protein [Bacteriophage sp.]
MAKKDFVARGSAWIQRAPEDGTSVTILSTKVLYQVSASPTDIPTSWVEDIKNAIQTDSKPYLWSKTIVAYSDNNKTVTFSVSYKGKDGTNGTSFTPKGTANGFFYNMSSVPSYEDGMDYDVYIVNVDDRSNPTSELPPYVCRYEYESFVVEHAEFGDGYNVNGHLYVANNEEWVDFGEIQGAKGDKGDDGMDAINIVFSPAELVFDADDNGNLKQAEKSAEVKVFRGNKQLTYLTDWDFPNVGGKQPGDNCNATFMVEENSSPLKPIAKIYDISSTKIEDTKPQAYVPASTGGINVPIKVNDVTYNAYLSFSVNVNTFAHTLIQDNKKYISKYTEVSNKYDAVSTELNKKADLKTVESTIEQTAKNIKLEVLSKTSGRRNMLVNSAFRNQDGVFIHSLARIEKNTGVDGVNCIHSKDTYSGTGDGNYIGAFWDSTQRNGVVTNIPIVKGKKYVISCWIKSDNLDLPFAIECLYMKSINQQSRNGAKGAISESFKVHETNKWEKISCVLDTDNADATEYLAVNFWSNTKDVPKATGATDYPICHAYICKPMMEEGDTYSGWTLSEDDYDYVGGNMIDNARTLEVGGSLKSINASNVADYGLAYYGDSMSLRINNTNADSTPSIMTFQPSLEIGVDYMFSFLAKGTANIGLYALCDNSVDGDYLLSEDSVNADVRIVDTFRNRYASIILIPTQLTTEYKRYWGHMRFYGHVPTKLYLQLNHAGEVYICQPKLEVGATMTEFTERKTDLVDKATLKKAGIEITTNQVKLYGDKVQVLTRKDESSEYVEAGMFVNGKLNANLIDADAIEVKHLWAKSEDGTSKVGYFGNTEKMEACKVDNTYAPLFIGADNAKNAPFHVTQDGAIYALMGRIGKFTLTDNGIFEYDNGAGSTHKSMQLSETCIYFTHTTDHVNNDRIIWMGSTDFVKPVYGISNLLSDIWIDDRVPEPTSSKACLVLRAEGGTSEQSNIYGEPTGNFAICASKGMYAGFRPMTRTISKSMALSELDCYVEVTAAVTLTLPANPQRGQTYWIMRSVDKGVKTIVKGNGKRVYTPSGNGETVEFTSANEIIWLTYIKDNWKALWVTP